MDKVSRGTGTLQNGSAEDAASVSSGSSKKAARELWKGRISKLDTTQKLDVIGICIYWAVRRVPLPKTGGDGILHYPSQVPEAEVEFYIFDKAYLDRLREGDPATEQHFVSYFEQLLRIKLRSKRLASDVVEDLQQKTFVRVIERVRRNEVRQPERFGAFVNSTCNHVLFEHYRDIRKNVQMDEGHLEMPDKVLDLEGMLVSKQCAQRVREVLEEMPKRDRDILRSIFLEEKDKDTVCGEFGVDRNYLRVLLHRAKDKFRAFYGKEQIGMERRARGLAS